MRQGVSKEYLKGTRRHGKCRLPLTKFLFSRVGRLWEDVHSELSQEFNRRTYVGYRFWRWNLAWEVAQNCWVGAETGTIYSGESEVKGFFVHPFTRILSFQAAAKVEAKPMAPVTRIKLDERYAYEKIEGIWYHTEYKRNDDYLPYRQQWELFPSKPYTVIEKSKRQLSTKELRHFNLTNDDPETILEDKAKAAEELKKLQQSWKKAWGQSQ